MACCPTVCLAFVLQTTAPSPPPKKKFTFLNFFEFKSHPPASNPGFGPAESGRRALASCLYQSEHTIARQTYRGKIGLYRDSELVFSGGARGE